MRLNLLVDHVVIYIWYMLSKHKHKLSVSYYKYSESVQSSLTPEQWRTLPEVRSDNSRLIMRSLPVRFNCLKISVNVWIIICATIGYWTIKQFYWYTVNYLSDDTVWMGDAVFLLYNLKICFANSSIWLPSFKFTIGIYIFYNTLGFCITF